MKQNLVRIIAATLWQSLRSLNTMPYCCQKNYILLVYLKLDSGTTFVKPKSHLHVIILLDKENPVKHES